MQPDSLATEPPQTDLPPIAPLVPGPTPHAKERGLTLFGLTLLIVSVLLQWIPVVQYLGYFLGAIGAIEMIRGAGAFRGRHELFVWVSVILFVCAIIAEFGVVGNFATVVSGIGSGSGSAGAAAYLSAWQGLVAGSLVLTAVISLCYLLIAFDLEDILGKLILVSGVAIDIVISVALFVLILNPLIAQAVTQAFASNPMDLSVIKAADAQVNGLSWLKLLNVIPAVLFSLGYARAHGRVRRGEGSHPVKAVAAPQE